MKQDYYFTEIPFSSPHQISMNKAQIHRIRPWPAFPITPSRPISTNFADANCMEQLLVHCAHAIDNNDATPAQQILWVLNNVAPPDGDSNQQLTCAFLRSLILRASRSTTCKMITSTAANAANAALAITPHRFSLLELAHFVDLTPWHRFGFTAANSIILHSISDHPAVHIVDLSVTHCMQIPTLIDSLATRFHGRVPPLIRLTVAALTEDLPPVFDLLSYDELGMRLINFARSKNIALDFKAVPTTPMDGFATLLDEVRQTKNNNLLEEELIVNCQMTLHYLQEEENTTTSCVMSSMRTMFLQAVRSLDPNMVVVVEEDADFSSGKNVVERLRSAFNYLWIPFDTVDTFLPRGSKQREWYEADVCWKIENVVGHEGAARVERQEPRGRWAHRMTEAGFCGVQFGDEVASEVKGMLEEHAAGWGSKKEEEDLVLTWKGHNVLFATAWVPN